MTLDPKLWEGHTPTPWRVEEDDEFGGHPFIPVEAGDGPSWHSIAEIQGSGEGGEITTEDRANAQLIFHAPQIEAERVRLREALAEIEKRANEAKDGWLEARHTDDGDLYRTATAEAVKWARIGVHARAALGPTS